MEIGNERGGGKECKAGKYQAGGFKGVNGSWLTSVEQAEPDGNPRGRENKRRRGDEGKF